jgi:hypothetical protein
MMVACQGYMHKLWMPRKGFDMRKSCGCVGNNCWKCFENAQTGTFLIELVIVVTCKGGMDSQNWFMLWFSNELWVSDVDFKSFQAQMHVLHNLKFEGVNKLVIVSIWIWICTLYRSADCKIVENAKNLINQIFPCQKVVNQNQIFLLKCHESLNQIHL